MTTTRVEHPILHLEVLAADGTRQTDDRVFCQLERRSVRVEKCSDCVHCDAIRGGAKPSVDCSIPVMPLEAFDDPDGERMEVGALLWRGTIAVAESAAVGAALGILRGEDMRAVSIVDDSGVLVGLVHEASFLGKQLRMRGDVISATMSTVIAAHERTPVRTALRLLAAHHLRAATVISDEGAPIGVFEDLQGLRWIAAAHRSSRR